MKIQQLKKIFKHRCVIYFYDSNNKIEVEYLDNLDSQKDLDVICIKEIVDEYKSNCYYSSLDNVYYKELTDEEKSKCSINEKFEKDVFGSYQRPIKVLSKLKPFGFVKAFEQKIEYDSGD